MTDPPPVDPALASATSIATFDRLADRYEAKFMCLPAYAETYSRLADMISRSDARVLDVGCGPGNVSRYLLDRHPALTVVGVDAAPRMVALARSNVPEGTFEVSGALGIDTQPRDFDVAVVGFCLPYLASRDVVGLLQLIHGRLVAGGLLYVSTMEGDHAASGWKTSSDGSSRSFVYYYDEPWLQAQLRAAGFDVELVMRRDFAETNGGKTVDLFVFARARTRR